MGKALKLFACGSLVKKTRGLKCIENCVQTLCVLDYRYTLKVSCFPKQYSILLRKSN